MKDNFNEMFCPITGKKCRLDCAWLVDMTITNNVSGENKQEKRCAIFWLISLQVENNRLVLSNTQAIESFRNEMVKGQGYQEIIAESLVHFLKLALRGRQRNVQDKDDNVKDALSGR